MIASEQFVVIGENVHTTRVLPLTGPQIGPGEDGRESIIFTDATGARRSLAIPETEKEAQAYLEGRAKHVRIAVQRAMREEDDAETARDYIASIVRQQEEAGAHYLDVNVDEVSHRLPEQIATMIWLVETVTGISDLPLAIDSSNLEIIEAGFAALGDRAGSAMLNSASLERLDALELSAARGGPVIVTAAGVAGMPSGADERVANATRMIDLALAKGISLDRIYVDPLIFPISVDGDFGHHALDAFRQLRARYGPEIHLTGGMSNVSFGLPARRVVNDAFLLMAAEAGADSGIIDPVTSPPQRVFALDRTSRPMQLAAAVLTGEDVHCRAYLKAWRAGELEA